MYKEIIVLAYQKNLKDFSRDLRKNMPPAEILLWSRLRKKQVLGQCFCRQKPLLNYIVDFYCYNAKLVIECDGGQHFEKEHMQRDQERDAHLNQQGILVLRFDNLQITSQFDAVMQKIYETVKSRISV